MICQGKTVTLQLWVVRRHKGHLWIEQSLRVKERGDEEVRIKGASVFSKRGERRGPSEDLWQVGRGPV